MSSHSAISTSLSHSTTSTTSIGVLQLPVTCSDFDDSISFQESVLTSRHSVDEAAALLNSKTTQSHCDAKITADTRNKILRAGQIRVWQSNSLSKASASNQLFSRDKLHQILDRETVVEILTHPCPGYCDLQRIVCGKESEESGLAQKKCFREVHVDGWIEKIMGPSAYEPDLTATALSLFGLLVMIQRPLLIVGFLDHGMDDHIFHGLVEHISSNSYSLKYYWEDLNLDYNQFQSAAEDFRKFMWAFTAPIFKFSQSHNFLPPRKFSEKRILPFVRPCTKINSRGDEGTAAVTVYKTHICPSYCWDPHTTEIKESRRDSRCSRPQEYRIYARKELKVELDYSAVPSLTKELENLQRVQNSKPNPHIIRILFAYYKSHCNDDPAQSPRTLNLIMPYIKANLHEYLRGESCYEDVVGGPSIIPEMKIYRQLQGVVGAIQWMINSLKMCRMDLKPENILVDRKEQENSEGKMEVVDVLILADFGNSHFKKAPGVTKASTITFPTYYTNVFAPPEAILEAQKGHPTLAVPEKFDVWSVGMIFVEIFTFLVLGCSGAKELSRALKADWQTTSPTNNGDCYYWQEVTVRSEPVIKLKELIVNWIMNLLDEQHYAGKLDYRPFVFTNLDLTASMLHPAPKKRIAIEGVHQAMKKHTEQTFAIQRISEGNSKMDLECLREKLQTQSPNSSVLGPISKAQQLEIPDVIQSSPTLPVGTTSIKPPAATENFIPPTPAPATSANSAINDGFTEVASRSKEGKGKGKANVLPTNSALTGTSTSHNNSLARRDTQRVSGFPQKASRIGRAVELGVDAETKMVLECKMGQVWRQDIHVYPATEVIQVLAVMERGSLAISQLKIVTNTQTLELNPKVVEVIPLHNYPQHECGIKADYAMKFKIRNQVGESSGGSERDSGLEESIIFTNKQQDMKNFFKVLTHQKIMFRASLKEFKVQFEGRKPMKLQPALYFEIWQTDYDYRNWVVNKDTMRDRFVRSIKSITSSRASSKGTIGKKTIRETRLVIFCATELYTISCAKGYAIDFGWDNFKAILRNEATGSLNVFKLDGNGVPMLPEELKTAERQKDAMIPCQSVKMTFHSEKEAIEFKTTFESLSSTPRATKLQRQSRRAEQ